MLVYDGFVDGVMFIVSAVRVRAGVISFVLVLITVEVTDSVSIL